MKKMIILFIFAGVMIAGCALDGLKISPPSTGSMSQETLVKICSDPNGDRHGLTDLQIDFLCNMFSGYGHLPSQAGIAVSCPRRCAWSVVTECCVDNDGGLCDSCASSSSVSVTIGP